MIRNYQHHVLAVLVTVGLTCSLSLSSARAVSPIEGDATKAYLADLQSGTRFVRNQDGSISDQKSGLCWQVGPDRMTSWEQACLWIGTLGAGWQMPTVDEVAALVVTNPGDRQNHPISGLTGNRIWCSKQVGSDVPWTCGFLIGSIQENPGPSKFTRALAVRRRV